MQPLHDTIFVAVCMYSSCCKLVLMCTARYLCSMCLARGPATPSLGCPGLDVSGVDMDYLMQHCCWKRTIVKSKMVQGKGSGPVYQGIDRISMSSITWCSIRPRLIRASLALTAAVQPHRSFTRAVLFTISRSSIQRSASHIPSTTHTSWYSHCYS